MLIHPNAVAAQLRTRVVTPRGYVASDTGSNARCVARDKLHGMGSRTCSETVKGGIRFGALEACDGRARGTRGLADYD